MPVPELEPLAPAGQRAVAQLLQDERRWTRLLPTASTIRLGGRRQGHLPRDHSRPRPCPASIPWCSTPPPARRGRRAAAGRRGLHRHAGRTRQGGDLRREGGAAGGGRSRARGRDPAEPAGRVRQPPRARLWPPPSPSPSATGPSSARSATSTNGTYAAHLVLAEGAESERLTVSIAGEPLIAGRICSSLAPPRRSGGSSPGVGIVAVGWIGALVLVLLTRRPRERGEPRQRARSGPGASHHSLCPEAGVR